LGVSVYPSFAGIFFKESAVYVLLGFCYGDFDKSRCLILLDLSILLPGSPQSSNGSYLVHQNLESCQDFSERMPKSLMAKKEDVNKKLIEAMEGDFYDPYPPDHILWEIQHGSPADQFVAVVKWHTCHEGHPAPGFGRRSPYAVDGDGNPLTVEQIGKIIYGFTKAPRWKDSKQTRHAFYDASVQGRVREDQEGRFWLRAKILTGNSELGPKTRTKPKRDELDLLPAYLRSQYKNLATDSRTRLKKRLRAIVEHQFPALALAAGRTTEQALAIGAAAKEHMELKPEHQQQKIGMDETVSIRIPDDLKDLLK
jgi:hypothetical protein